MWGLQLNYEPKMHPLLIQYKERSPLGPPIFASWHVRQDRIRRPPERLGTGPRELPPLRRPGSTSVKERPNRAAAERALKA